MGALETSLSSAQRKSCVHGSVNGPGPGVGRDTYNSGRWEAEARRAMGKEARRSMLPNPAPTQQQTDTPNTQY